MVVERAESLVKILKELLLSHTNVYESEMSYGIGAETTDTYTHVA